MTQESREQYLKRLDSMRDPTTGAQTRYVPAVAPHQAHVSDSFRLEDFGRVDSFGTLVVWTYKTVDTRERVLTPGYFDKAVIHRKPNVGDWVLVTASAGHDVDAFAVVVKATRPECVVAAVGLSAIKAIDALLSKERPEGEPVN